MRDELAKGDVACRSALLLKAELGSAAVHVGVGPQPDIVGRRVNRKGHRRSPTANARTFRSGLGLG